MFACHTYHKFVNTTPKPNATKNSSGELVGPPPPPFEPPPPLDDGVGPGAGIPVEVAAIEESIKREPASRCYKGEEIRRKSRIQV